MTFTHSGELRFRAWFNENHLSQRYSISALRDSALQFALANYPTLRAFSVAGATSDFVIGAADLTITTESSTS